jgi:hypothetical protein
MVEWSDGPVGQRPPNTAGNICALFNYGAETFTFPDGGVTPLEDFGERTRGVSSALHSRVACPLPRFSL